MLLQFTAVQIYSCFLYEKSSCPQKLVRKMLSLNSDLLIAVFRKAALAAKKTRSITKYERSGQYSKITYSKTRLRRRAAPAAQRRLAGQPKAGPDASLPRSEINQFLPASRFIASCIPLLTTLATQPPHTPYAP